MTIRVALSAALVVALLGGCTATPGLPTIKLVAKLPTAATPAAKAAAKAAKLAAKAPTVSVVAGAAPTVKAQVEATEPVADATEVEFDETLDSFEEAVGGYQLQGFMGGFKPATQQGGKPGFGRGGKPGFGQGGKPAGLAMLQPEAKQKLLAGRSVRHGKRAARQELKAAFAKAAWVDNGDGTKSKAVTLDLNVALSDKTIVRHLEGSLTVDAETNALVQAKGSFSQQMPNGASLVASRDKALQADGSYLAVHHSVLTLKDGTTRTADGTRTTDADGKVTGQGSLNWTDASGKVVATRNWTVSATEGQEAKLGEDVQGAQVPLAGDEAPAAPDAPESAGAADPA